MHKKNNAQQASLQPLLVFVVLMMMVLMQMTADQYVPSLPAIAKAFNSTETSTQLTLSLFMLGLCISHLFYGPLSDKIGRKPPLMLGVSISILGSLICHPIDVLKNYQQRNNNQYFTDLKKNIIGTLYKGYSQSVLKNLLLYSSLR